MVILRKVSKILPLKDSLKKKQKKKQEQNIDWQINLLDFTDHFLIKGTIEVDHRSVRNAAFLYMISFDLIQSSFNKTPFYYALNLLNKTIRLV